MAAFELARSGLRVHLFEKKRGPGRKFLIAGSSGLNVTYDAPLDSFVEYYRGPKERFQKFLSAFPPEDWLRFINDRGIKTFKGTSKRYFVEGLKGSTLLRAWLLELGRLGVLAHYDCECTGFELTRTGQVRLRFSKENDFDDLEFDAVCFALGGGSWEKTENPLRWPKIFEEKSIRIKQFEPSNVGFEVDWPRDFISQYAKYEGKPLKNITLSTSKGKKRGDVVLTRYGLEGTPVYFLGEVGPAALDLKPDLTHEQILKKLEAMKENRSPLRRVKKLLNLEPTALAILEALAPKEAFQNLNVMARSIKALPLTLRRPRPLVEAISSTGGLDWSEVDDALMLKKFPGVFVAGEMLDWDAPTGGFLIQGCVSQGHFVARGIKARITQALQ